MKFYRSPSLRNQSGYTLVEIMLVLGIIAVLAGSAIYLLVGNLDVAKEGRVDTDIQAISTQLKLYEMMNFTFPTTAQGLDALVKRPSTEPLPRKWRRLMEDIPIDPWGQPYIYKFPGDRNKNGFDLYSSGPDRREGGEDDLPQS